MKKYDDEEIWKIVKESKNKVKVSNHGRFETIYGITSGCLSDNNYLVINYLNNDGESKNKLTHRIVAKYFVFKNQNLNLTVDHIDEDKTNNHWTNLQWLSDRDNIIKSRGIAIAQYTLDGKFIKFFRCIKDAEIECGISSKNISNVTNVKRHSAGGFIWIKKHTYDNFPKKVEKIVNAYRNKKKHLNLIMDFSVYKIDMNTNEILEKINSLVTYESNPKRRRVIKRVCADFRKKSAYGYKWKFVKEDNNV